MRTVNALDLSVHHTLWHSHLLLGALVDVLITPQTIHREDLRIGLLRGRLEVGIEADVLGCAAGSSLVEDGLVGG